MIREFCNGIFGNEHYKALFLCYNYFYRVDVPFELLRLFGYRQKGEVEKCECFTFRIYI